MSYGKIMSNCGTGMQRLFGSAKGRVTQAAQRLKKSMSFYDDVKPYSKMTAEERMAHDLEHFAPDDRAMQKYHDKMVKRHGPDYASMDDEWMMDDLPRKKNGWW